MTVHGRLWVVVWGIVLIAVVPTALMGRALQTAGRARAADAVWTGSDTSPSDQLSPGRAFLPLVLHPHQLEVPRNVQATDAEYLDQVQITWTPVSRAAYYENYRAPTEDGEKNKLGSSQSTDFVDYPRKQGKWYFYWVTACNGAGCSDFSDGDQGRTAFPGGGDGDGTPEFPPPP
jgi:hypothetical protein